MRLSGRFLKSVVFISLLLCLSSCGDEGGSSKGPKPIVQPSPGNENSAGGKNETPWALIRFVKHTDAVDPDCVRDDIDDLTIRENGQFRLEECHGVKEGTLTVREFTSIRNQAQAVILAYKSEPRICAESSPFAELYLTMVLDNGEEIKIYEELTEAGLCSYGNREAALTLYSTVLGTLRDHNIPSSEALVTD